jgi:adenylyltransferase/sulfurtransferase
LSLNINQNNFFKRQTTLDSIGLSGQKKIQNAKIAIIGCGGLGSIAAVYLAGSGIGQIKLIDFDTVSVSNLHRQTYYSIDDIGKSKAGILAKHIKKLTPFTKVSTSFEPINKDNIDSQLQDFSIILDCTDDLQIKYLINDYCVIKNKIMVYGSLFKFDGYVATFNFLINEKRSANLRDAFPEIPKDNIPNCSETGTLNTIVGLIGLMQANEVLKIVSGQGKPLINQILIYNSLENSQFKMKLSSSFSVDKIKEIFKKETYNTDNCNFQSKELIISKKELEQIKDLQNIEIISVIEDKNIALPFDRVTKIPFSKLKEKTISLKQSKKYIIICNRGITSYKATLLLKDLHPDVSILSLEYGIDNY